MTLAWMSPLFMRRFGALAEATKHRVNGIGERHTVVTQADMEAADDVQQLDLQLRDLKSQQVCSV